MGLVGMTYTGRQKGMASSWMALRFWNETENKKKRWEKKRSTKKYNKKRKTKLRYEMVLKTKQESFNSVNTKWGKMMNKNG